MVSGFTINCILCQQTNKLLPPNRRTLKVIDFKNPYTFLKRFSLGKIHVGKFINWLGKKVLEKSVMIIKIEF